MANSAQATKRARQNVKNALHNASLKSRMRTFLKKTNNLIEKGDKDGASKLYNTAARQMDKMVNKHLVHGNKVARLKSRLVKRLKAMA